MTNFELFYQTSGVCTDTRNIQKDCLFVCLKGANFNGNTFALEALRQGAKYVIVDEEINGATSAVIRVENALVYLQQLANYHRHKFQIPIIGITGSNGKTTSKELIATVLSKKYNVHFTKGNLNNHIGVPLTLLQLNNSHEIAVIEMGANKFHDIEELCAIAEPTHGIITNIGMAHLEGFINFEGVLKTKLELYDSIVRNNGILFYNVDDSTLTSNLPKNIQAIGYGSENPASVVGELVALSPFVQMKWKSDSYQSDIIETRMIGKYNFYNFLAAISIGLHFQVDNEAISDAIRTYTPTNNRSQVEKTANNTLILDAYNANPTSMKSALESFARVTENHKIALLGDMFELGAESAKEHQKIIDFILEINLNAFLIGKNFYQLKGDFGPAIQFFVSKDDVIQFLEKMELKDHLILLKGSRGIGLESIVPYL